MVLYKGFRHERSKGDDGLRTNYWYLQRVDGSEDLAVIGREIKGSGGHYNYNSAPLFGMLSWVNSSEVRRWLQTKIADTQTLRSVAAAAPTPGQDALYAVPLPNHSSDMHLNLGQDLGLRTSSAATGTDLPWGLNLSSTSRAPLDASAGLANAPPPGPAMIAPLVGAHSGDVGFITDKHQRNAVIGHTLGLVEAQLDALRQRTGVDYTMTLVTQERELHVLGSAAVTWRASSSQASSLPEVSNMASPLEAQHGAAAAREDSGQRAHAQGGMAVPSGVESEQGPPQGGTDTHLEDDTPPPAWQLQTKRALTDLWNLSELEDSRKRMAPGQSHAVLLTPSLPM